MEEQQQQHQLLSEDDKDYYGLQDESLSKWLSFKQKRTGTKLQYTILVVVSLLLNILLFATVGYLLSRPKKAEEGRTRWANLKYEVDTPIYAGTKYGPYVSTEDEIDRHWLALDVSPGLVRLTDDFARANDLPLSMRFPWGENAGMYYLGAFHQIHCLKEVHFWISDTRRGLKQRSDYHHVQHCLDTLLQDAMCHADDLPWYQLPGGDERKNYAQFQMRKCKNFDQLLEWSKERNACFQYDNVTDPFGNPVESMDENYRYCPEGSPYTEEMMKYFDEKYAKQGKLVDWEHQPPELISVPAQQQNEEEPSS